MYELIKLSENDYYIDCPTKIGIVKTGESEAVLIDSGNDKDAGKKALRILEENGWTLKAIYLTHSHADHIGGCNYLQGKTGCKIYAFGIENCFTNNTILESAGLYGGFPFEKVKCKFLYAKQSECLPLTESVLPDGFEIINLPGHSFDMVGFRTKDNNIFIADAVMSKETLEKYKISYLYDAKKHLSTLEYIKTLKCNKFVPAHSDVVSDITEIADYNISVINEIKDKILYILIKPFTFEEIMQKLFFYYNLRMNEVQNTLVGSVIRSYLSWLNNEGLIDFYFEDNRMLWQKRT